MNIETIIASNMRELRRKKDLTQEYISTKLSISQSYYSELENGKHPIPVELLNQLSEILAVEVSTFFNGILPLNQNLLGANAMIKNNEGCNENEKKLYEELVKSLRDKIETLKGEIKTLRRKKD